MVAHHSERPFFFGWIDFVVGIAGLAALFLLLTNGVPLIQVGWIAEFGKKSRYTRLMLISVPIFAALLLSVRLKWPQFFPKLCWVKAWDRLCRIPLRITVLVFFVVYAAMMTLVGFERHLALETRSFDLGIFAQAVWNTLHGDIFFSSIKENINLMGDHVSPILLGTVPFYAIWPDPRMLVLLQALAAASSFFPLALIARDKLKDRSFVLIFLLMFFFYQPVRAALHDDFHPEILAEPFLWWAFFFLEKKNIGRFWLCLAIAVTGKENFLGIAFMFGVYVFIWKKMRWTGTSIMIASVGLFVWETKWLVPHLSGAKYFYSINFAQTLLESPAGVFKNLFLAEPLGYAAKVFSTFLFLPLLHFPTLILAFPVFFQNFLASSGGMRSFNYHYFTGLTPFLFISTIYALARWRDQKERGRKLLLWGGFLLLFLGIIRSGPSEYWFFWSIKSHRNVHSDMVRIKLREIPGNARVMTHNAFVPQLCGRKYIYQFNYHATPSKLDCAKKYSTDTVIWDLKYWEPNTLSPEQALKEFQDAGYSIAFLQDGFYILARKP